jgi:hypothetical protein
MGGFEKSRSGEGGVGTGYIVLEMELVIMNWVGLQMMVGT